VNAVIEEGEDPAAVFERASDQLRAIVEVLLGPEPRAIRRPSASSRPRRVNVPVLTFERSPRVCSNFTGAAYGDVSNELANTSSPATSFRSCRVNSSRARAPSIPSRSIAYCGPSTPRRTCNLLDSGDIQIVGGVARDVDASPRRTGQLSTRSRAPGLAASTSRGPRTGVRNCCTTRKEIAEHVMLVDLGRNDVGRVATPGTVRVDRLAHIERYSHLMHLVSHVEGRLKEGLDASTPSTRSFRRAP